MAETEAEFRRATDAEIQTARAWTDQHMGEPPPSGHPEDGPERYQWEQEAQDEYEHALEILIFANGGRDQPPRPTVVCLCGSGRFSDAFRETAVRETLAGRIVLTLGVNVRDDAGLFADLTEREMQQLRARLDILHRHRILMADEVLVLDVDGYIGESTRLEVEFAEARGKRIRYLSAEKAVC